MANEQFKEDGRKGLPLQDACAPEMGERHLDLDCGIAYQRIEAWLEDELALPREDERWVFASEGETCTVMLERLEPRTLAGIQLERTHLVVGGEAPALETFERLFTLRFMSAGG